MKQIIHRILIGYAEFMIVKMAAVVPHNDPESQPVLTAADYIQVARLERRQRQSGARR